MRLIPTGRTAKCSEVLKQTQFGHPKKIIGMCSLPRGTIAAERRYIEQSVVGAKSASGQSGHFHASATRDDLKCWAGKEACGPRMTDGAQDMYVHESMHNTRR